MEVLEGRAELDCGRGGGGGGGGSGGGGGGSGGTRLAEGRNGSIWRLSRGWNGTREGEEVN